MLGILGTVGPVTPFGSNQAGVDLPVSGGLSTGSGKPGGISFRLGTPGGSGFKVNDSDEVARIDVNGYKLPAFTFAKLPPLRMAMSYFALIAILRAQLAVEKAERVFAKTGLGPIESAMSTPRKNLLRNPI